MFRGPAKTLTVLSALAAVTALLLAGAVDARGLAAPRASGPPNGASFPEQPTGRSTPLCPASGEPASARSTRGRR